MFVVFCIVSSIPYGPNVLYQLSKAESFPAIQNSRIYSIMIIHMELVMGNGPQSGGNGHILFHRRSILPTTILAGYARLTKLVLYGSYQARMDTMWLGNVPFLIIPLYYFQY